MRQNTSGLVKVKTYITLKKNGKVVHSSTFSRKRDVCVFLKEKTVPRMQYTEGSCIVVYRLRPFLWNKFSFKDYDEFVEKLDIDTETALMKHVAEGSW